MHRPCNCRFVSFAKSFDSSGELKRNTIPPGACTKATQKWGKVWEFRMLYIIDVRNAMCKNVLLPDCRHWLTQSLFLRQLALFAWNKPTSKVIRSNFSFEYLAHVCLSLHTLKYCLWILHRAYGIFNLYNIYIKENCNFFLLSLYA